LSDCPDFLEERSWLKVKVTDLFENLEKNWHTVFEKLMKQIQIWPSLWLGTGYKTLAYIQIFSSLGAEIAKKYRIDGQTNRGTISIEHIF
jgi:hypothetical protein